MTGVPSRYVYDRSLQADVADILASQRVVCHADCQLATLDAVVRELCGLFAADRDFDPDRFARRARAHQDRIGALPLELPAWAT